ncbi:MAG: hypothetical protein WCP21_14675 [Armatimonadota bacterium]
MRLEPLHLWFELGPGPLRSQVLAALARHGDPLRWAITAVETLEATGAAATDGPKGRRVRVEAVLLR